MTKAAAAATKGKELWRTGADIGLEPGTKLVIKKPKPREAGDTPYEDDTIHPNTLLFLKDLANNNDREWLKSEYPSIIYTCHHSRSRRRAAVIQSAVTAHTFFC